MHITLAQVHHGRQTELNLVNLTSHPIYLYSGPPGASSQPAKRRCVFPSKLHGELRLQQHAALSASPGAPSDTSELPIYDITTLAQPATDQELPPRLEGTLYIVSRLVADVLRERDDFVFPYDLVRDEKGIVIGCTSLARFVPTLQTERIAQ